MSYEAIEDYLKRGGEVKVLPPAPNQKFDLRNVGMRLLQELSEPKTRDQVKMTDDEFRLALSKLKKWGFAVTVKNGRYSV